MLRALTSTALWTAAALACRAEEALPESPPSKKAVAACVRSIAKGGWAEWTKAPERAPKGEFWCAGDPSIVKDGPLYRMYFTGVNPSRGGACAIVQATSKDALKWEFPATGKKVKGLAVDGEDGTWDHAAETCFALQKDGETWLYYCGYGKAGWQTPGNPGMLGLATSKDGVNFKKSSDKPILRPTPRSYDANSIFSPCVLKEGDEYVMIYCGHAWHADDKPGYACILGATSKDGINWTKRKTPVLLPLPDVAWARESVAEASLLKGQDGKFYLFFTGLVFKPKETYAIGIARGDTPFGPWDVNPEPIVEPSGRAGAFDETRIIAPGVFADGDAVRLWYHGFASDNTISMGCVESKWPLRGPAEGGEKK